MGLEFGGSTRIQVWSVMKLIVLATGDFVTTYCAGAKRYGITYAMVNAGRSVCPIYNYKLRRI